MNPQSLKQSTVLVTGVGAVIGCGIVRSLRQIEPTVRIVGMDIFHDAVGQTWCDRFAQTLRADHPDYPLRVAEIIARYDVDLVIPGIEQDVFRLREAHTRSPLKETAARFALNRPELIQLASDKWQMHLALLAAGFPAIPSWIDGRFDDIAALAGCPFLLKPRRSHASRGIQRITCESDFLYWKQKLGNNFMVQQIVGSDDAEFTVAAFGLGDGRSSDQIAFRRILGADGSTAKATTARDPLLEEIVHRLVRQFVPLGPTNFQFRLHAGEYLLLEINPRISSSTSLRTAFGYNEAEMCVEFYLHGKTPGRRKHRGGSARRYIEDIVHYDADADGT